ncbi:MAG: hypothetical protein RI897_3563 [Verrucomicrobiota bacterium]
MEVEPVGSRVMFVSVVQEVRLVEDWRVRDWLGDPEMRRVRELFSVWKEGEIEVVGVVLTVSVTSREVEPSLLVRFTKESVLVWEPGGRALAVSLRLIWSVVPSPGARDPEDWERESQGSEGVADQSMVASPVFMSV